MSLDALKLDPTTTTKTTEKPKSLAEASGLGQDAFLKIFLAQLSSQDPLNPQDSTQLSSQLAQFSQLEQSLKQSTTLESLGTKLDTLIELAGGGKAKLDPISLLGRQVDFEGKGLAVSGTGDAPALAGDVGSPTRTLAFQVTDRATGDQALAELQAPGTANLPLGSYQLSVDGGSAHLVAPTAEGTLEFRPLVRRPDGTLVVDEGAGAFQFVPGATYDLKMLGISATDAHTDIPLRRSGVVSSVRIEDGTPILKVDGADVDITQIQQIR